MSIVNSLPNEIMELPPVNQIGAVLIMHKLPQILTKSMIMHAKGYNSGSHIRWLLSWLFGSNFWLTLNDCAGLFCFSFGFFVLVFINYITMRHVIIPAYGWSLIGILHYLVFESIVVLATISMFQTMLTQPGIVPKSEKDMEIKEYRALQIAGERLCVKCFYFKPARAHHCSTCRACVIKMDHHCPWVNNCIGANNQKFFLLFLLYVAMGTAYSFSIMGWRTYCCIKDPNLCFSKRGATAQTPWTLVGCVVAFILAIFFFAFVVAMGFDQYAAITDDLTYIEALKDKSTKKSRKRSWRDLFKGLKDIFGESEFRLFWLIPMNGPKLDSYILNLMNQFEIPDSYVPEFVYSSDEEEEIDNDDDKEDGAIDTSRRTSISSNDWERIDHEAITGLRNRMN